MNRAWIPAGALASVSVAGLLALGPLTDSLGTTVPFQTSVPVETGASTPVKSSVPVNLNRKVVGETQTAALKGRGGAASVTQAPTAGESGYVGYRRNAVEPRVVATPAKPAVKPAKKAPTRPQLGATGETNGDNGLAGDGQGTQGNGEASTKLAP